MEIRDNEKNVEEYCKRHNIYGGILDNIAVTFETIQESLKEIMISKQEDKELTDQLIKNEFIDKPKENKFIGKPKENVKKKLILKEHYFSDVFVGMESFKNQFHDKTLDNAIKNNDNFKIMTVLFRMCSNSDFMKKLKQVNLFLGSYKHVYIDKVNQRFESLISKINEIEQKKNKIETKDIISIFKEFGNINNTIQDMSKNLFSLSIYKKSLSKLADEYWKNDDTKNKVDDSAKLPINIIKSNATNMVKDSDKENKIDDDANEKLLINIIQNNAPDMTKNIESLKGKLNTNHDLKNNLALYKTNQDKRKQYTLLNPLHWSLIWKLSQERKKITKNILSALNGKSSKAEGTKINNLNEKLVVISKENFETNSKTKSLDNKERKDEIIFKSGSCVVDNSSESQKSDEKQHGN